MELYREEDFYKDKGWPPEEYAYCDFCLPVDYESVLDGDYDQFVFVVNSLVPYLRLTKKRGCYQFPCGKNTIPSTDGRFASLTDEERNEECPKIVWGVAARFIANLGFNNRQKDFVLQKDQAQIFKEHYDWFWTIYKSDHSGLRFAKLSIEQKEWNFLSVHKEIEQTLWKKSTPLKAYSTLYNYANNAIEEYERFLLHRQQQLERRMKPNNNFSTEICSSPGGPYIRVFFFDDSNALKAKEVVEAINSVKKVNSRASQSASHPGQYLIVYLKSMVTPDYCVKEIHEALTVFFSSSAQASSVRKVKTDAYFDNIEKQVINDLKAARVSILVAMAWFTNQRIADVLVEKYKEGLDVRVVSFDDHVNAKFGVDLDGIPHKKVKSPSGGIMHDKFCVIDNQKVLTGSYNWSVNAENKNVENVPVIYDDARASDYSVEFRRLFDSI